MDRGRGSSTVDQPDIRGLAAAGQLVRRELPRSGVKDQPWGCPIGACQDSPYRRRRPVHLCTHSLCSFSPALCSGGLLVEPNPVDHQASHKPCQFTSRCGHRNLAAPAATDQPMELLRTASHRPIAVYHHLLGLAFPTTTQRLARRPLTAVVPAGLHEQSPDMPIAGLGNSSPASTAATGMFAGNKPEKRHEVLRTPKPSEIPNLGDHGHGRQVVDTA